MTKERIINVVSSSSDKQTCDRTPRLRLIFSKDSIKLSTLIERHVLAEASVNTICPNSQIESTLSDHREKVSQAFREFESHKYIVVVNDQQIKELDEDIPLRAEMNAIFIKLPSIVSG